jgi:hypothetical protein
MTAPTLDREVVQAPPGAAVRFMVLVGEDADAGRRGDKQAIAMSDCRFHCPDGATANKVIEALRDSDEKLRSRPEELMLWDWRSTWFEARLNDPNGAGTVILGVAWYDLEFYTERRGAAFSVMHKRIYEKLGLPLENIEVTHYRLDA